MSRRGANEGTIRLRPDGRWEARVVVTATDGRRLRRSLLARTQLAARKKLHEALRAEAAGRVVPTAQVTVAAFLEEWLEDTVRPSLRPSTFTSYGLIVHRHLVPGLGRLPLARLSPRHVQLFLNAKLATGLSPRTVAYLRAVLRQALGRAESWSLVNRNAAKLARPPRVPRREVRPLTLAEARLFLDAIHGDQLEALYLIALAIGLRQGEILGLTWPDIDSDTGTLTVRHALQRVAGRLILVEPKSATSHRVVAVPAVVADALRHHRQGQRVARLRAGARWREDARDFVFTSTIGTPLDGITVTRRFQACLAATGLPRQRFHDLRHACASLLLAEGIAPRVVMETLGHSQISLTMNTYSHVAPALVRAAAIRMDEILSRRAGSEVLEAGRDHS